MVEESFFTWSPFPVSSTLEQYIIKEQNIETEDNLAMALQGVTDDADKAFEVVKSERSNYLY